MAGHRLQPSRVQYLDIAPAVADQTLALQGAGRLGHANPAHAERMGQGKRAASVTGVTLARMRTQRARSSGRR